MSHSDADGRSGPLFEKRRHRRYHVKNVSWAVLKNGGAPVTVQVMDIGFEGLSVHSTTRLRIAGTGARIDLLVSRTGLRINRLPVRTVFCENLPPQIPFGPAKWRYGLKFGNLTLQQQTKLETLIAKHTIRHFAGKTAG